MGIAIEHIGAFPHISLQYNGSNNTVICAYCGWWKQKGLYCTKDYSAGSWSKARVICRQCRETTNGGHNLYHYLRNEPGYRDPVAEAKLWIV